MSKIALTPDASGTGTFTIASPNSNTNRTLTLPDEAGTVLTNTSNLEAQVKTATNASGSAPMYICRAWVNFNGTGTVAIRASGNVSSITDNGVGDYTINFTTAMPDANYSVAGSARFDEGNSDSNGPVFTLRRTPQTTTAVRVIVGGMTGGVLTLVDCNAVNVAIFR
jgi:hypothetical protein